MRKRLMLGGAVATLACMTTGVGLTLGSEGDRVQAGGRQSVVSVRTYEAAFGALRGTGLADGVSQTALEEQGADVARFKEFAEDAAHTRFDTAKVMRTFSDRSILVAASDEMVCLRERVKREGPGSGGGMGCAPTRFAIAPATPIVLRGNDESGFSVTALPQDPVKTLRVDFGDAAPVDVEVINNVASGRFARAPTRASWVDADGRAYTLDLGDDLK